MNRIRSWRTAVMVCLPCSLGITLVGIHIESGKLSPVAMAVETHSVDQSGVAYRQSPAAGAAVIDTVAGTGGSDLNLFSGPVSKVNIAQTFGVEIAPDGGIAVCEVGNHRVLHVDLNEGKVTTLAGNGILGSSPNGVAATEASLNQPYEVRFDAQGNMYFVEMRGAVVRKVVAKSGRIYTVAGTGKPGYGGDGGPATQAQLRSPHSIALDGRGGLYIADIGNHRIRRVDLTTGRIDSVAGNGERSLPADRSIAAGKPMAGPRALYIRDRTMWIALREGHSVWTLNLDSGRLTHIAGTGKSGYRDGPAKQAQFNGPKGIVVGPAGDVFVADTENQVIRRIDPSRQTVTTVAGMGPEGRGFGGDGGPARHAMMDRPHGIACDSRGTLYIGDTNNHRVRRVRFAPAPRR